MGFKGTTLSSLAILATFLLLISATAVRAKGGGRGRGGASSLCKGADNPALCMEMTKGATRWPEAVTNMINAAIQKVMAAKPVVYAVAGKLPGNLKPLTKQSIDSTCKETFDTLLSNLQESLGFVNDDPTAALNHYASSVSFFDCTNALEEFGITLPEISEFDNELTGISSNLVAVVQTNHAYA